MRPIAATAPSGLAAGRAGFLVIIGISLSVLALGPALAEPAPAPQAAQNRSRSVGPGARNWATGNRVPLHRPWMRPRG
jgi:hypothetical protein